jgi:hypothetical protein
VPFPGRGGSCNVSGVGREAAGAEARSYCVDLYAALEAPLFHSCARFPELFRKLFSGVFYQGKITSNVKIKSRVKGDGGVSVLHETGAWEIPRSA